MTQDADKVTISDLWPTVVLQSRFAGGLDAMTAEVYRLNALPGGSIKKSNYGGWPPLFPDEPRKP